MSNIRTEINGLENIKMYCKKNSFNLDNPPKHITFRQKKPIYIETNRVLPLDYHDFGFRINLKEEKIVSSKSGIVKGILSQWNETKKTFRFIKRFTFRHADFPLKIDCSIVKTSKRSIRHRYIPQYRIQDSKTFERQEEFEIEIEILPPKQISIERDILIKKFKSTWRYILSGIQDTNYPISYSTRNKVLGSYIAITQTKKKKKKGEKG